VSIFALAYICGANFKASCISDSLFAMPHSQQLPLANISSPHPSPAPVVVAAAAVVVAAVMQYVAAEWRCCPLGLSARR